MEIDSTSKIKFSFSGHESFQCRQLWLKKGYDFLAKGNSFNDEDAVVKLGVGKNMVSAIRYWLKAFNIIDLKDKLTEFGKKLLSNNGYDPFLEDEASIWLLHYQLTYNRIASIYSIIFNEFRKEKLLFNRETFLNYMNRRSEIDKSLNFNENTIITDFGVFIKMYQGMNSETKDVEESYSGILSELELLNTIQGDKKLLYQIEINQRDNLPPEILLFTILSNNNYGNAISLNSIEFDYNSPGSIFAISRAGLINKIEDITQQYNYVTFIDHAGIKELQFRNKPNAYSVLDQYYGK